MGIFANLFSRSTIDQATRQIVEDLLNDHARRLRDELGAIRVIQDLRRERDDLESQVARLRDQVLTTAAENARSKREMEHKLGLRVEELEAKEERMGAERELIMREAKVAAREEALGESRELLKGQLDRLERVIDSLAASRKEER